MIMFDEVDLQNALMAAIAATAEAGKAILEVYQKKDFNIRLKSDESPLTEADTRSQEIIQNSLHRGFENLPFLGEEDSDTEFNFRKNWDYFWLVDPLDGTKEFIKRNGEFTINIALMRRNTPIFGIIYLPVADLMYFSINNQGA